MPTSSELRSKAQVASGVLAATLERMATLEALVVKGDGGRLDRAIHSGLSVQAMQFKADVLTASVHGTQDTYLVRITQGPQRSWWCTCPDSQARGRTVGPCKHTLTLALHCLDQMQPEIERINSALMSILA